MNALVCAECRQNPAVYTCEHATYSEPVGGPWELVIFTNGTWAIRKEVPR